jgi:hypothetical protein
MKYEEINDYAETLLSKYSKNFEQELNESLKSVARIMYSKGFNVGRESAQEEREREVELYYKRLFEVVERESLSLLTYKESLVLAHVLIGEVFNWYGKKKFEKEG